MHRQLIPEIKLNLRICVANLLYCMHQDLIVMNRLNSMVDRAYFQTNYHSLANRIPYFDPSSVLFEQDKVGKIYLTTKFKLDFVVDFDN